MKDEKNRRYGLGLTPAAVPELIALVAIEVAFVSGLLFPIVGQLLRWMGF